MKSIFITLTTLLICSLHAEAQTFKTLVPGSNYACITMPDGTIRLGEGQPDGYSLVTESEVKAALNTRARNAKSRTARLNDLLTEVQSKGKLSNANSAKAFKAYANFVKGTVDPAEDNPRTKEEQIALIKLYIQQMAQIQAAAKFQVKAVDYCYQKKEIIPPGDLKLEIIGTSQGVAAVLWGREKAYFSGANYCSRGNNSNEITTTTFRDDPCGPAEFSCMRKGYVGIYLGGVGTDHPLSKDDIAYWSFEVTKNLSSLYEIKLRPVDKHYSYLPCTDVLINLS